MAPPTEPPVTEEVTELTVACDEGGGALGHPKVFLSLEGAGEVKCPYCDKKFVLKPGSDDAGH